MSDIFLRLDVVSGGGEGLGFGLCVVGGGFGDFVGKRDGFLGSFCGGAAGFAGVAGGWHFR